MKILFIGSNPSVKAGSCAAFTEDTVSGRVLRLWIKDIDGTFLFENLLSQKTENNRPLNKSERAQALASLSERIKEIAPDRVIGLGKTVCSVLAKTGISFLEMPHPSGLNRQLNDREFVDAKIDQLRQFCR